MYLPRLPREELKGLPRCPRGSLGYREGPQEKLTQAIAGLANWRDSERILNLPRGTPFEALAWQFGKAKKFLTDCSSSELLIVIKVLCQHIWQIELNKPKIPEVKEWTAMDYKAKYVAFDLLK